MISVSVTIEAADAQAFLVRITGKLEHPHELHEALGTRLADELKDHFRTRNSEPNNMGGAKTNFWSQVAEATRLEEFSDAGATVAVAEQRFRIHLFGGVIRPTGGRKFLTIPLIKEARTKSVRQYEAESGRKLFRLPGSRVLVERFQGGDRSLAFGNRGTVRNRAGGYRKINIGGRTRIRSVFALSESANIKQDPRALPDRTALAATLQDEASAYLELLTRS